MLTTREVAKTIDHSILHPTHTDHDLKDQCKIALEHQVATVCVKPYHVRKAAEILKGSDLGICAVVGFPHGGSIVDIKRSEAEQAIEDGATDIDMVINIAKALQGDFAYIHREIATLNSLCVEKGAVLKVIFETDYITDDADKIRLCEICNEIQVAFVKTSTGFGFVKTAHGYDYTGANPHDVTLLRKHCKESIKVKASGGVRNLDDLLLYHSLGAAIVGSSSTVQIIEESRSREERGELLA